VSSQTEQDAADHHGGIGAFLVDCFCGKSYIGRYDVTEFPTLPDLEHIRDLLWRSPEPGPVSVLIGAGFSRNAVPAVLGARPFPLWRQLAERMASGMAEIGDPLGLAQMYVASFSEMDLRRLIEAEIPDAEHRPGPSHQRLLDLPWADVFTTNYDTLLGRR
jgi:hypothetical protein